MLRRSLVTLSLVSAVFSPAPAAPAAPRFAENQVLVIVQAPDGTPRGSLMPDAVNASLAALGLRHHREIAAPSPRRPWSVHRLRAAAAGFDPVAAAAVLRGTAGVIAAIPNYRLELFNTFPNDPMRGLQWHVDSGDSADIELTAAWDVARGDTGTVIGIMDTGVDLGHPDLVSQIWSNRAEAGGQTGVDDDGNGYVDDLHGWDFGDGDADPNPGPFIDEIGLDAGFHGTFVAGIAAARTHNGIGISGAAWHCRVLPLKVSNSANTIQSGAVAEAFTYATDLGIAVLNMSLGGPGEPGVPEFFQALVDAADDAGVLCVAAAGNSGVDTPSYPAANDRVLAVAATDGSRQRAEFSNYGSWVDVAAPGAYLWSSICRNYVVDDLSQIFYFYFFEWDFDQPYMRGDGTSFACPLAAGVCALVRSLHPQLTPAQVASHVIATGDPVAFDQPIGPKVNAWRAVSAPLVSVAPAAGTLRWDGIVPQPVRGSGVLRFALAREVEARVEIFDLAGRRVRTLEAGVLPAGEHARVWDGRDQHGLALPDGVYLIRLQSGAETSVGRAVLLRR